MKISPNHPNTREALKEILDRREIIEAQLKTLKDSPSNPGLPFPPLPVWIILPHMKELQNKWRGFRYSRKISYMNNHRDAVRVERQKPYYYYNTP